MMCLLLLPWSWAHMSRVNLVTHTTHPPTRTHAHTLLYRVWHTYLKWSDWHTCGHEHTVRTSPQRTNRHTHTHTHTQWALISLRHTGSGRQIYNATRWTHKRRGTYRSELQSGRHGSPNFWTLAANLMWILKLPMFSKISHNKILKLLMFARLATTKFLNCECPAILATKKCLNS